MVMWTDEDDSELYSLSQCHKYLNELAQLKLEAKAQVINVLQLDWFESGLVLRFLSNSDFHDMPVNQALFLYVSRSTTYVLMSRRQKN
ncbi:hypothetical protein SN11_14510 [Vibrio harveyi]|nr:hypothetical protein SN11_14510 [Vibrio harveyi]